MFLIDLRLKKCVRELFLKIITHVLDQYKTQQMCDKADDNYLAVLKFALDWFVTSKIINDSILYFNENSGNAVFSCNGMGIHDIDYNNINLDDTNYDEDGPETIAHIKFWLGISNFKNAKQR